MGGHLKIKRFLVFLMLVFVQCQAAAFYNPKIGRWTTRGIRTGGVVILWKTKKHNTVLVTQALPRGASAHARYLAASKISARQDGRTILRTRLVFAVSPRSALSHSNLAICFRGKFRNEFLRCSMFYVELW